MKAWDDSKRYSEKSPWTACPPFWHPHEDKGDGATVQRVVEMRGACTQRDVEKLPRSIVSLSLMQHASHKEGRYPKPRFGMGPVRTRRELLTTVTSPAASSGCT